MALPKVPDEHTLVSYGNGGRVEEYNATGRVVWRIEGKPGYIFRAQRIRSLYYPGVGTARKAQPPPSRFRSRSCSRSRSRRKKSAASAALPLIAFLEQLSDIQQNGKLRGKRVTIRKRGTARPQLIGPLVTPV